MVIIDVSIDQGGICAVIKHDRWTEKHGMQVCGIQNIPGMLISRVPPLLHPPLMAMTNAISAITILAALTLFSLPTTPLEKVLGSVEMKAINPEFHTTDLVLVVGACDVVNPAAIVCNFDGSPGYSEIPNSLYDSPNSIMIPGNAKETTITLLTVLQRMND